MVPKILVVDLVTIIAKSQFIFLDKEIMNLRNVYQNPEYQL